MNAKPYPNKALADLCNQLLNYYELTPEQIASLAADIPGECKAIEESRDEAAYERQQQSLMETGGPDDSQFRKDLRDAGRGHLLK